jgi:hypothetical protein
MAEKQLQQDVPCGTRRQVMATGNQVTQQFGLSVSEGKIIMAGEHQHSSLLATTGVVISLLPWIACVAAIFYGAIDISPESDEALKQFLRHQARVQVSLISLAFILAAVAIWIAGLSFERARVRSLIALCSCGAFVATGIYVYAGNTLHVL